jgi:hypothetical protein
MVSLELENKIKRLGQLFNELSEYYWSAGWLVDLDVHLWSWLQDSASPLRPEHREELSRLSHETGKWFWWPDDKEQEEPIDIKKWKVLRYNKVKEQQDYRDKEGW